MSKKSGNSSNPSNNGSNRGNGGAGGGGGANPRPANAPSTTDQPSGGNRGNNPPKK